MVAALSNKAMQQTKRTEAGVRAFARELHFMSASQLIAGVR
jgi:hypothetical protein